MFWEVFYAILLLLTGIGVFLVGIIKFSNVLQSSNNDRIKKYFEKLGNNRAKGFALGAGATTIIQSSTATTVITVGLVNAGIITFAQSTAVVFGANVGTALSNMLISLSAFRIKYFFMVLVFVGAFSKILVAKPKVHKVADVLIAFGIIFVGLEIMSIAFRNNDALVDLFSKLFNTVQFPLLLVLIGFILAAIMNSSTAATALLITFAANGALTFISIMFLFIGIKLGTTLTTLIASIPASRCAKRVAVMHLLFNVFGALIFLPIIWSLKIKYHLHSQLRFQVRFGKYPCSDLFMRLQLL